MNPAKPVDSEQALLESAARLVGFQYLMYVPDTYPHKGGLLYRNANGRLRVWNPRLNDADLLQLAIAAPMVNLHEIIVGASQVYDDDGSRRAYVRETFLQAIAWQDRMNEQNTAKVECHDISD